MDLVFPSPHPLLPSRPAHRATRNARWLPTMLGLLVTAGYFAAALRIHAQLGTGMDLAIFDQGVRSLSQGHWPTSAMKSVGMNLWGDHFHPILVVLAPLYWIWDDPRMLLCAQAAAMGLGCAILTRSALRLLPDARGLAAGALGLSLALAPGTQWAMVFDVDEVAFGVPILAVALTRLLEGNWRGFTGWSLALLLVKEDAGLLVFGLAMVAFLRGRRRLGVALGTVATGWTLLVVNAIIPALSPTGDWLYRGTLAGPWVSLAHAWHALAVPGDLTLTVTALLLATGLLALRSALVLALLPSLAIRAISGNPAYWGIAYHYNLLPGVVLAFAALDAFTRTNQKQLRRAMALVLLLAAGICGLLGPARIRLANHPDPARIAAAAAALRQVPDGEPVAADVFLTPQLTAGHPITQQVRPAWLAGRDNYLDDIGRPLAARWIVLDRHTASQGGGEHWVPQAIAHFRQQGFRVVHDDGIFVVLTR